MGGPKLVYLMNQPQQVGSLYKYVNLLRRRFGGVAVYADDDGLRTAVRGIGPDLVVVRGDFLQHWRIPRELGIPYLLVENDVHTMRHDVSDGEREDERRMIEEAGAVLFTSPECAEYCAEKYRMDTSETIALRPSRADLPASSALARGRLERELVFAGGVLGRTHSGTAFGYRVYHNIFRAFIDHGWIVHLYLPRTHGGMAAEYALLGCEIHPSMHYRDLLSEMGRYTAGLLSYAVAHAPERAVRYTQASRPNKTWDYLAAGIPTICVDAGAAGDIVEEGGWGVKASLDDIAGIEDRLPRIDEEMRRSQVMDEDLPRLERLVEAALEAGPR